MSAHPRSLAAAIDVLGGSQRHSRRNRSLNKGMVMSITGNDKIFISYAKEDRIIALRIYDDLIRAGLQPWIDCRDLQPGQRWKVKIREAIESASIFVPVISNKSVNKRGFVQRELRLAIDILNEYPDNEVYIIPVRIDDAQPRNEELCELQWIDLFPAYSLGIGKLLNAVASNRSRVDLSNEVDRMPARQPDVYESRSFKQEETNACKFKQGITGIGPHPSGAGDRRLCEWSIASSLWLITLMALGRWAQITIEDGTSLALSDHLYVQGVVTSIFLSLPALTKGFIRFAFAVILCFLCFISKDFVLSTNAPIPIDLLAPWLWLGLVWSAKEDSLIMSTWGAIGAAAFLLTINKQEMTPETYAVAGWMCIQTADAAFLVLLDAYERKKRFLREVRFFDRARKKRFFLLRRSGFGLLISLCTILFLVLASKGQIAISLTRADSMKIATMDNEDAQDQDRPAGTIYANYDWIIHSVEYSFKDRTTSIEIYFSHRYRYYERSNNHTPYSVKRSGRTLVAIFDRALYWREDGFLRYHRTGLAESSFIGRHWCESDQDAPCVHIQVEFLCDLKALDINVYEKSANASGSKHDYILVIDVLPRAECVAPLLRLRN